MAVEALRLRADGAKLARLRDRVVNAVAGAAGDAAAGVHSLLPEELLSPGVALLAGARLLLRRQRVERRNQRGVVGVLGVALGRTVAGLAAAVRKLAESGLAVGGRGERVAHVGVTLEAGGGAGVLLLRHVRWRRRRRPERQGEPCRRSIATANANCQSLRMMLPRADDRSHNDPILRRRAESLLRVGSLARHRVGASAARNRVRLAVQRQRRRYVEQQDTIRERSRRGRAGRGRRPRRAGRDRRRRRRSRPTSATTATRSRS